jgi:hypothetical protein
MNNDVGVVYEFREKVLVFDAIEVILEILETLEVPDVLHAPRGKIVQQNDPFTSLQQSFREMRADKPSTARDEISQRSLLKFVGIIQVCRWNLFTGG